MKRPSFQFYPTDWLSDYKVAAMTPGQRGGYIQMLCHMWNTDSCSLPKDEGLWQSLSGLTGEDLRVVQLCFNQMATDDTTLVHKRLLLERKKQDEWRKKSAEGGKKSGVIRLEKSKRRVVRFGLNQTSTKTNTPSSTLTPSSIKSPTEIVAPQQTFGKEEINKLLEFIKKELSLSGFKESCKEERIWGQNLSVLAAKIGKAEFVSRFQGLAAQDFYRKNMGSLRFIYKNIKGWVGTNADSSDIIQPLTKAQYAALTK